MMIIFDDIPIDLTKMTCHTGGAVGADSVFEELCLNYGVAVKSYSYKTSLHNSVNKVEISDDEYIEGVNQINKANRYLGRFGISKYMNLLARNWAQVKYSTQIFAIGYITDPGKKSIDGYYSKAKYQSVSGGTGYAVQMGINNNREIFVYDLLSLFWYRWSYSSMSFIKMEDIVKIGSENFAGIGTRKITTDGIKAISNLFENTFKK